MSVASCAGLVQRGDPDRMMSVMAAPLAARPALIALYAFNLEVSRAPWVTQEPMIAEMRLQWWRDALAEIAGGGVVRAHEVVEPLAHVLDAEGAAILDRLIVARRWDIYREPFEDEAHLENYLQDTSGGLMWAAARALGAEAGESAIRDTGFAMGVANWLKAAAQLEAQGRIPLLDGRPEAVARLAALGLSRLGAGGYDRRAVPALRAAWQTRALLQQARRHPERVAQGALALSEFRKKGSLLLRAALGRP